MLPRAPNADAWTAVAEKVISADADLQRHCPVSTLSESDELADALYADAKQPHEPEEIFPRLRWGGQFAFASRSRRGLEQLAAKYSNFGFVLTQAPGVISEPRFRIRLPLFDRKTHFFVARKVQLLPPGGLTERFTYHVFLEHEEAADSLHATPDSEFVVVKEVPTLQSVVDRLRRRWPELSDEIIEKRARKFTDKIFPIFLTREAALLKIIHQNLPEEYRQRIPKVLHIEKDSRGYVRRFHLNWLRNGGEPLAQVEFARQSADLLRVLHDRVGVMHLDLRLDNFVITEAGVGFVDFGSAVRQDEDLRENPLLSGLFEELMRTSEIQQMLSSMTRSGQVTSQAISCGLHKVDKAVDYFYLAVQISAPHANPDLKGLIKYDPRSDEALALKKLTARILRPKDPVNPKYRSAADIYRGIEKIRQWLGAPAVRSVP